MAYFKGKLDSINNEDYIRQNMESVIKYRKKVLSCYLIVKKSETLIEINMNMSKRNSLSIFWEFFLL